MTKNGGLTAREKRELAKLRGWSKSDDKRESHARWRGFHNCKR